MDVVYQYAFIYRYVNSVALKDKSANELSELLTLVSNIYTPNRRGKHYIYVKWKHWSYVENNKASLYCEAARYMWKNKERLFNFYVKLRNLPSF